MCHMKKCCFYVPLKAGCVIASVIELALGVIELILYVYMSHEYHKDERVMWIVAICNMYICCTLLFIGSWKEERICLILHSIFIAIFLLAQTRFETLAFNFSFLRHSPDWLIAYNFLYHIFLLYMIPASISLSMELKESFSDIVGVSRRRGLHRLMSSVMSSEVYGM